MISIFKASISASKRSTSLVAKFASPDETTLSVRRVHKIVIKMGEDIIIKLIMLEKI